MILMDKSQSDNPEICPNCYVGRISRNTRSLVIMHGNKPVALPAFPAWACDVCNAFVYDPVALAELQTLLTSNKRETTTLPDTKPMVKRRKVAKTSKAKTADQK